MVGPSTNAMTRKKRMNRRGAIGRLRKDRPTRFQFSVTRKLAVTSTSGFTVTPR